MKFRDPDTDMTIEFDSLDDELEVDDLRDYIDDIPDLVRREGDDENKLLIPSSVFDDYAQSFIDHGWEWAE